MGILVQGAMAGRLLNRISRQPGRCRAGNDHYTQWMKRGWAVWKLTSRDKLSADRFLVVVTVPWCVMPKPDEAQFPDEAHAFVTDVLGLRPAQRAKVPITRGSVQKLTTGSLERRIPSHRARDRHWFRSVLCIASPMWAARYELYIPDEQATQFMTASSYADANFSLGARRTQGDRESAAWKRATATTHRHRQYRCAVRGGPRVCLDLKKPGGFIGKEAVLAQRAKGPLTRRLVQVLVKDPEPLMFHAEVVRRRRRSSRLRTCRILRPYLGGAVGLVMIEPKVPVE